MVVETAKYISECPALSGVRVCVNYLSGNAAACSLRGEGTTVLKPYSDGSSLCGVEMVLAIRTDYGEAAALNKNAADRLSDIEAWLNERADSGILPETNRGITPVALELKKGFSLVSAGSVDARYEAVLRVVYYSEGRALQTLKN